LFVCLFVCLLKAHGCAATAVNTVWNQSSRQWGESQNL